MELIIKEGINTKHCPNNTCESIMLALYNKKVSGIYLNVFKTKDNILVVNNCDKIMKNKIKESKYKDLLKYNLGSKVKKHFILTLDEVFKIYNNSNKKIVLKPCSKDIIDDINLLASNYNLNIFIETEEKNSNSDRCINNIGINLCFDNLSYIHYDYDFLMIDYKSLKDFLLIHKLKNHKEVMFYNINTIKDYIELERITKNYTGNISIISNDFNLYSSLHLE